MASGRVPSTIMMQNGCARLDASFFALLRGSRLSRRFTLGQVAASTGALSSGSAAAWNREPRR